MAQQFYKRPNVHRDDSTHGVYDDHEIPGGSTHGQSVSDDAQGTLDNIDDVLADAERNAGETSAVAKDATGSSATELEAMERSPFSDPSAVKLKDSSKTNSAENGNRLRKFIGSKRGKRVLIGSGAASVLVGGSFGIMSILGGPLQFIHLSQILQKAYFSHQEDAGDSRVGRLYRFMRNGGDVGETRLTYLQSKYKTRMLNQFAQAGLKPVFDSKTGYFSAVEIDTDSDKSPYKDMSKEQAVKEIEKRYGTKITISSSGVYRIEADTLLSQRRALNGLSRELGYSKITTAARTRVLAKYGMVSWHPLHILDKKVNTSVLALVDKYRKKYEERIKNGSDGARINTTGATSEDDKGNKTTIGGTDETATQSKARETLESIKNSKGLKITGGIAAAVGIICTANTVRENLGPIRWEQVILPITRVGMNSITAGDQIRMGNDVDPVELDALSRNFVQKDKNGKVVSSWDQAAGIQSITGGSGGKQMDQGTIDMIHNETPDWLEWTKNSLISGTAGLCSGIGTFVTGSVSVIVGIFSGGTASTVVGLLGSSILGPVVIDRLSALVAGDASNALGPGATFGNNAALGAFFGANAAALPLGGMQLSAAQTAELNRDSNLYDQHEYTQRNMFARMFDPMDYRSVTARMIDSQVLSTPTETVGQMVRTAASLPQRIGDTLASVFMNRTAFAATGNTYGIAEVGFSVTDLENEDTADPYANAEYVAKNILDKNGQGGIADYIGRADKCFGVRIAKDENQKWAVVPARPVTNLYDGSYPTDECRGTGDAQWQKVRMFILDSGVMDGMACTMGDDTSCKNNNGEGADTGAGTGTNSGSIPSATGYVWPLSNDVLKNVTVSYCWFMPSGGRQGHTGIDMPVPVGTPVFAAKEGTVVQAGPGGDAGNYIMIKHDDGHWTNYQHLSRIDVRVGQSVTGGEQIGLSGDGGYSTSGRPFAHLHFSVTLAETLSSRLSGAFTVDPLLFLPPNGPTINCR